MVSPVVDTNTTSLRGGAIFIKFRRHETPCGHLLVGGRRPDRLGQRGWTPKYALRVPEMKGMFPNGAGDTLPLRPLWPGFALNTLFYATFLWLMIPGPFALRRFIRVRRGLCPKCAYPMGESAVCSECGREMPRGVRTA